MASLYETLVSKIDSKKLLYDKEERDKFLHIVSEHDTVRKFNEFENELLSAKDSARNLVNKIKKELGK